MRRTTVKELFAKIQAALDAELVETGLVTRARCLHGPAEEAVYAHLVSLREDAYAALCYGLDPTVTLSEDATLNPDLIGFPCAFSVLVPRTGDLDADNDRLADLYEATVDVFSNYRRDYGPVYFGAQNIVYRGVRIAMPAKDYLMLGGVAEFHVHHVPYTNE